MTNKTQILNTYYSRIHVQVRPQHSITKGWQLTVYSNFYNCFSFLAALGLHSCARVFSSCGERGLLFVEVRGLQELWLTGSRAQVQNLWRTGLVTARHVGSSQTRDRTHVPCTGRRILNHCATREVPQLLNSLHFSVFIQIFDTHYQVN